MIVALLIESKLYVFFEIVIDNLLVFSILGFIGGSFSDPHNQGNFGPFQICYDYGISVCGGGGPFKTRGKET